MDFMELNLGVETEYLRPTVVSLFKTISSGIGLDIAKNHTGVVIWNGTDIEEYGFKLMEYDRGDYFAECKMRRDFKSKLTEIINGRSFEHCIVEDVYGGDNFDTVRKLLALNTVIDDLILDGVCHVDNFYRWSESQWLSCARTLYKQTGKLRSKVEIQGILEYLGYDFLARNQDLSEADKKAIFYEDKCDACGMLLGVVASKLNNIEKKAKPKSVPMSDIKMLWLEGDELYNTGDAKIDSSTWIDIQFNYTDIEAGIKAEVALHPHDVMCVEIPTSKLGRFGMKYGLEYYEGKGYLLFYNKKG